MKKNEIKIDGVNVFLIFWLTVLASIDGNIITLTAEGLIFKTQYYFTVALTSVAGAGSLSLVIITFDQLSQIWIFISLALISTAFVTSATTFVGLYKEVLKNFNFNFMIIGGGWAIAGIGLLLIVLGLDTSTNNGGQGSSKDKINSWYYIFAVIATAWILFMGKIAIENRALLQYFRIGIIVSALAWGFLLFFGFLLGVFWLNNANVNKKLGREMQVFKHFFDLFAGIIVLSIALLIWGVKWIDIIPPWKIFNLFNIKDYILLIATFLSLLLSYVLSKIISRKEIKHELKENKKIMILYKFLRKCLLINKPKPIPVSVPLVIVAFISLLVPWKNINKFAIWGIFLILTVTLGFIYYTVNTNQEKIFNKTEQ